MFAEKQVVLLKEAQHMQNIDKLEPYIAAPLHSTIFVIGYKGKGYDRRSKFYKLLQKQTDLFNSTKIFESKINDWIIEMVRSKGYTILPKAASLLEEHVGNDLSRLANEIDKLAVNLQQKLQIDETDIEKYIGISKEYNVFELQAAIARKDLPKAISIIGYFELNPKAGTIHMAVPAFYAHFSKVYAVYGMNDKSDAALRPFFYNNPNSLKQAQIMMKNYGYAGMEKIILLLHQYNLKSIGVGDTGTNSASLMKELVVKMILC